METGEAIREARKKMHMTQSELADILHISESAVQKYETGKNQIPTDRLAELADALHISVYSLLGLDKKDIWENTGFCVRSGDYSEVSKLVEFLVSGCSEGQRNVKMILYFACIYWLAEEGILPVTPSSVFHMVEEGIATNNDQSIESKLDKKMEDRKKKSEENGKQSKAAENYRIFKIASPIQEQKFLASCLADLKILDNQYQFL